MTEILWNGFICVTAKGRHSSDSATLHGTFLLRQGVKFLLRCWWTHKKICKERKQLVLSLNFYKARFACRSEVPSSLRRWGGAEEQNNSRDLLFSGVEDKTRSIFFKDVISEWHFGGRLKIYLKMLMKISAGHKNPNRNGKHDIYSFIYFFVKNISVQFRSWQNSLRRAYDEVYSTASLS